MNKRQIIIVFASLAAVALLSHMWTRAYYKASIPRFSRQLVVHAGDARVTINSPFRENYIKEQIALCWSTSVRENPAAVETPGIELDTWIWICKNGKLAGGQHTGPLFLRRIGGDRFQFWTRHDFKFQDSRWFALEEHDPSTLGACIDFYWARHLGPLIRDFDLDWYAENPEKPGA